MKTKTLLIITVFSICIMALVNPAFAIQVTRNNYEEAFPHMEGNFLVWQGNVDGDWEIFLYDIANQQTHQITDNDYNDISPQTDGTYVTWVGYPGSGGDIFVYEIATGTTTLVTNDAAVDNPPKIADGKVVWTSFEVADSVGPGDVYLYDIQTGPPAECLSCPVDVFGTLEDELAKINSKETTWVQTDGNTVTRFIYEFPTGPASEAPEGFVWSDSPQKDGNLIVSTAHDRHDREIFLENSVLDTRQQLTQNATQDAFPCISGSKIAWVNGTGSQSEILLVRDETEYEEYLADGFEALEAADFDPPPPSQPDNGGNNETDNNGNGGGGGGGACFVSTLGW